MLIIEGSYDPAMDDRYPGYVFTYCGRTMRIWRKAGKHEAIVEVIAAREFVHDVGWAQKRPPLVLRGLDAFLFVELGKPEHLPFALKIPKLLCSIYARCITEGIEIEYFKNLLMGLKDISDSIRANNAKHLLRYL